MYIEYGCVTILESTFPSAKLGIRGMNIEKAEDYQIFESGFNPLPV